jgi:hypothetical protein
VVVSVVAVSSVFRRVSVVPVCPVEDFPGELCVQNVVKGSPDLHIGHSAAA